jgi:aspartyl-tRNA(Asn)/glutamyl-tRNA(Gln) amidotransferase subunit B
MRLEQPIQDLYKVDGYYPTIGIECHVQLKTKTKLFAGIDNNARGAEPNTLVSHICFGMPGALPVLNEDAIKLAMKAAFALNSRPQEFSKFDRKHYFYPDLPLGYQITQFEEPIILGGHIDVLVNNEMMRIGITRAHLEADAGKSTHPVGTDYSLVDLNRAGTPLLEIVSDPDMHNGAEARAYAEELYLSMKYADVSDVDLYHGNMRFDINVSVSKDPQELGTRSETKNLNSFKSIEKTVEYEIKRQITVLEKGEEVLQETRGWDDAKQSTFSQRTKEDAHDYRYFPDPDIPPVVIAESDIEAVHLSMPVMPADYRRQFATLNLDSSQTETIINEPQVAEFIGQFLEQHGPELAKTLVNWFTSTLVRMVADQKTTWDKALQTNWLGLAQLIADNKISSTSAKEIIPAMLDSGKDPESIAEEMNLIQVSDTGEVEKIVDAVLAANPKPASDVKNGEMKAIGFLVGQVMKQSQGKANPAMAQKIIRDKLGV